MKTRKNLSTLFAVAVLPFLVGSPVLADGLVGWWKFDERKGDAVDGKSGRILANRAANMVEVASFKARKWLKFDISADTAAGKYDLKLNNKEVVSGASFAEALTNTDNPYKSKFTTPTVERIVFRTGAYRQKDFSRYGFGANDYLKHEPDLPNADEAVDNAIFDIDDFRTACAKP